MATDVFPFAVWLSGTNQNSIPANDNALRVEVITGPALSIISAQPASPTEGDQHIIGVAPTGAHWATFAEDDVVIFKGGTWLAFEPYQGWLKFNSDDGDTYQWDGGWTVFAGGGGGSSAWGDLTGVPQPVLDIAALTDPGADRLLFWDDSAGVYTHLSLGTNLSISGSALNAAGGGGGGALAWTEQTINYTLELGDAEKALAMNSGSANSVTVPDSATVDFPVGTRIAIYQQGSGATSVFPGSGVLVRRRSSRSASLEGRYARAELVKRDTDEWYLSGELEEAVPVSAQYWRLLCVGAPSGDFDIGELRMRSVSGGSNIVTGGTAIESDHFGSFVAANAFDGDTATMWVSTSSNAWVGYQFPSPVTVVEYGMENASFPGSIPTAFDFQWSTDGSVWNTIDSRSGVTWAANTPQYFTID